MEGLSESHDQTGSNWQGHRNHRVGLAATPAVGLASGSGSPGRQPRDVTPGVCLTALTDVMAAMNRNGNRS